jgi:hypothetical protein
MHRARRARPEKETASEPLKRNREKKIDALDECLSIAGPLEKGLD